MSVLGILNGILLNHFGAQKLKQARPHIFPNPYILCEFTFYTMPIFFILTCYVYFYVRPFLSFTTCIFFMYIKVLLRMKI